MNPIFSESVRRMLRRRRKAPQKQSGSYARDAAHFPSKGGLPGSGRLILLWFGLPGALVTALCLLTPLLGLFLGAIGLDWLNDYLRYGLFPALFIFIGIAVYAWWQNRV